MNKYGAHIQLNLCRESEGHSHSFEFVNGECKTWTIYLVVEYELAVFALIFFTYLPETQI